LLGSEIFSNRTREAVLFGAKFMKEDLPYFVELFAEVANETRYVREWYVTFVILG
jgi:ubiquinol-cytochrome c reductase core subunit 2